jgi:hypothetical protein
VKHVLFMLALSAALAADAVDATGAGAAEAYGARVTGRKGEPLPVARRHIPYEDVLDHSDVVLAGKVIRHVPYQPALSMEQKESLGRVDLRVQKVLRGRYAGKVGKIIYGTASLGKLDDAKRVYVFLCVRQSDGTLRLAADPPVGGGHVWEGLPVMEDLLEAQRDPVKGYRSKEPRVKFSSAYRLARAWLKTPPGDRPAPPPGLVETLLDGLLCYRYGMGRNGDAAAWNAINALFACDIKSIWDYPPEMKKGRRTKLAKDVTAAWERTKVSVWERRAERANRPRPAEFRARVAGLIEQLGSDKFHEREAARHALVKIGKPALKQVREGAKSENPRIAEGCRLLMMLLPKLRDFRPTQQSYRFDLDRAEPFVPEKKPEPAEQGRRLVPAKQRGMRTARVRVDPWSVIPLSAHAASVVRRRRRST